MWNRMALGLSPDKNPGTYCNGLRRPTVWMSDGREAAAMGGTASFSFVTVVTQHSRAGTGRRNSACP